MIRRLAVALLGFAIAMPGQARDAEHEAAALADAIAAAGCMMKEADAPAMVAKSGVPPAEFPSQMFALMETGHLVNVGDGVMALRDWGICDGS